METISGVNFELGKELWRRKYDEEMQGDYKYYSEIILIFLKYGDISLTSLQLLTSDLWLGWWKTNPLNGSCGGNLFASNLMTNKGQKNKKKKNTKNAWERLMWFINSEQYSLDRKKRGKFWEWQRPFTKPRGEYVTAVMIEKCRSCWLPLYSLVISTEIGDTHSN